MENHPKSPTFRDRIDMLWPAGPVVGRQHDTAQAVAEDAPGPSTSTAPGTRRRLFQTELSQRSPGLQQGPKRGRQSTPAASVSDPAAKRRQVASRESSPQGSSHSSSYSSDSELSQAARWEETADMVRQSTTYQNFVTTAVEWIREGRDMDPYFLSLTLLLIAVHWDATERSMARFIEDFGEPPDHGEVDSAIEDAEMRFSDTATPEELEEFYQCLQEDVRLPLRYDASDDKFKERIFFATVRFEEESDWESGEGSGEESGEESVE